MVTTRSFRLAGPLPAPATVAAGTSPDRDRAIDVARLLSLLVVMFGHCSMVLATVTGSGVHIGDLLISAPSLQPVTWALQVMPLFFLAGGASSLYSLKPGTSWGAWLLARAQRLCRPVFWYLAVWTAVLVTVRFTVGAASAVQLGEQCVSLLWFLGVYLLVLACVPALNRIRTPRALWTTAGLLVTLSAVVDLTRINTGAIEFAYPSFLIVWLIPAVVGIGYVRKLIAPRIAILLAAVAVAVNIVLVTAGPYQVGLVVTGSDGIPNTSPPTVVLALHCLTVSLLFVAAAAPIRRWAQRPRVWYFVAVGNAGAMTLYLWHILAIAAAAFTLHLAHLDAYDPHQPAFPALLALRALVFALYMAALFPLLTPLEQRPLPWWDTRNLLPRNDTAVGILICLSGIAILLAAKQGLGTPTGWSATTAFALTCLASRALCTPTRP